MRKIASATILIAVLTGCTTKPAKTPVPPAAAGHQKIAFLSPARKLPEPVPEIPEPIPLRENIPAPSHLPHVNPIQLDRKKTELPASISNWSISRVSASEWRVAPARRIGPSDSPPSLMEDAIITAGIHARLQTTDALRSTTWQYSSNSGHVVLICSETTISQALAALQAVLTLDKVSDIRLITTLQP